MPASTQFRFAFGHRLCSYEHGSEQPNEPTHIKAYVISAMGVVSIPNILGCLMYGPYEDPSPVAI